jgi:hypothetical protein
MGQRPGKCWGGGVEVEPDGDLPGFGGGHGDSSVSA